MAGGMRGGGDAAYAGWKPALPGNGRRPGQETRSCPTGNGERPGDRSGVCPTKKGRRARECPPYLR